MSPPLSGSGAECSGRVHGGPSGTDRDGLGRRVHGPGRIGPRPRGALRPHRIPTLALREDRSGRRTGSARQFPHDSAVPTKQPSSAGWNDPPGAPLPAPAPGIRDRSAPTTRRTAWTERRPRTQRHPREPQGRRQPVYYAPSPPLRPSSPYSEGPRSEAEQKRRSRRTARTGIGDAQRARPSSRPRRHRPGRARRCPSPTPPGPRRPRPVRPGRRPRPVRPGPRWCEPGLGAGRARGDPEPSRTEPGLRNASPARRNPPALDPRRLTSHNASPGDITKSTPPASPRRTPVDRPGDAGASGGDGRRGPAAEASPPLPDGPVPRQAGPSVAGRCRCARPVPARVRRSPPGAGRPRPS